MRGRRGGGVRDCLSVRSFLGREGVGGYRQYAMASLRYGCSGDPRCPLIIVPERSRILLVLNKILVILSAPSRPLFSLWELCRWLRLKPAGGTAEGLTVGSKWLLGSCLPSTLQHCYR